ncbi:MAG: iron ABC transporter permease [Nitrospirales bacterium]
MATSTVKAPQGFSVNTGALLPWAIGALVFSMLAGPLSFMLIFTFAAPGTTFVNDVLANPTLANYQGVFGSASTYRIILNTLIYAVGSIAMGLPIALTLAWLMERTDMPGRNILYGLMFIPMAIPPFATAAGWILLLGPNAGLINQWIRGLVDLGALSGPFNIYSLPGMIFVTGLAVVPTMWLLMLGVFRNMDPSLEEAGSASGLSRFSVIREITLPLMRPGILGVLAYYGVVTIAIFEIPLALGLGAGIPVLSTRIFMLTQAAGEGIPAYGPAAALGLITMAVAIGFMYLYIRVLRDTARFTTVTGKGYRPRRLSLGNWKWLALGMVIGYFLLQVILPYFILLWSSLLRFYQAPSLEALGNVTFYNYARLFDNSRFLEAVVNTGAVVFIAATGTVLLAAIISWLVVRRPSPITRTLNVLAFAPLAIPATVIALAFLIIFIRTPLYGTVAILIIAFVLNFLAFTSRLTNAAQMQLDKSLEESAVASGLTPKGTFLRITLPLLFPALLNGWMWAAVHIMRDFTIPLFLGGFNNPLLANIIFERFSSGGAAAGSAPIVLLVTVVVILALLTRKVFSRQLAS